MMTHRRTEGLFLARLFARVAVVALVWTTLAGTSPADTAPGIESRKPSSAGELRYWLENMVWNHRFTLDEMAAATGMAKAEIEEALKRFDIRSDNRPEPSKDGLVRIAPWPGGRTVSNWPGEIERTRQRETKATVFTPWDPADYVVLDAPEAIWSNLGLVYLAHVDVPTIWTQQKVELEKLEWTRRADGGLELTRELPNKIAYHSVIRPTKEGVRMKITLTNGTPSLLTDLRVQNCVFLKGLKGFENEAKPQVVSNKPYTAYGNADGTRWVITVWEPFDRIWNNPINPCFHSDPRFDDCPPGESRSIHGWLSFYEGKDVQSEFKRLDKLGWQSDAGTTKAPNDATN